MSKFIFILLAYIGFTQSAYAEKTIRDKDQFVICYSNDTKSYYFDWDKIIATTTKQVFFIEVKSCSNLKYVKDIPLDELKVLDLIKSELPEEVLFSIKQIENGAHKFRTEKTALEYINNRPDQFKFDSPEVLTQLRYDVGDQFAMQIMNLWLNQFDTQDNDCSQFIGTCDFYLCQEKKEPCGLDGYNLSYGYKYCSRSKFSLLKKMKTNLGKKWTESVFQCLQSQSLVASNNNKNRSCEKIKDQAYASHPGCYINSGFCELNLDDKLKILKTVKEELFTLDTIKQGLEVLSQCQ